MEKFETKVELKANVSEFVDAVKGFSSAFIKLAEAQKDVIKAFEAFNKCSIVIEQVKEEQKQKWWQFWKWKIWELFTQSPPMEGYQPTRDLTTKPPKEN